MKIDTVLAANENEAYLRHTLLNASDGRCRFDTLVKNPDLMRKDLAATRFIRLQSAPSPDMQGLLERTAAWRSL